MFNYIYNEELKNEFIKTLINSKKNRAKTTFDKFQKLETKLNKDLSFFTKEEALKALKKCNSKSYKALHDRSIILSEYVNYRLKVTRSSSENIYKNISTDEIKSCLNHAEISSYVSYEEIKAYISKLTDYRDKFVLLAIYEGLGARELSDISLLSVKDFDENSVCINTTKITVSPELKEYALKASEMKECERTGRPLNTQYSFILNPERTNGDYSTVVNKLNAKARVLLRFSKIKDELNLLKLTPLTIQKSGFIHNIKQVILLNNISLNDAFKAGMLEEVLLRYDKRTSVNEMQRMFRNYKLKY